MIAISDNDQKIIAFLIKNYASRFTTREIGLKLKISPAGSYKSLKKMEKGGIVVAEKLGTGLFYDINLRKTSAFHLACFVASTDEKDVKELSELTRLVLKHQNGILVVTGHHSLEQAKAAAAKIFKEDKLGVMSDDEFVSGILSRDNHISGMIQSGTILFGSEFLIKALQRRAR
ncbi:hypothetical protein J4227_01350 [Candidatus Woesearchaeota archaeon]|nr:hypothetical protein [Candidatus Woesearchaeota archaeon]